MAVVSEDHSRGDEAYDYLVDEITAFRIRTGAPLSENRIAAQLGVSRTPVREALQRLEKEGLVRRTESARFTVTQPSRQEASDACDLLEVLDAFIAVRAAERMTEPQAEALRASVERMRAAAAVGDEVAWSEADLGFHRLMNSIAGNALVAETVKETRRRVQRFWVHAPSMRERLTSCSEEHQVLAQAMIDKDYAAIEPAVRAHISHMRDRILDLLATASILFGE